VKTALDPIGTASTVEIGGSCATLPARTYSKAGAAGNPSHSPPEMVHAERNGPAIGCVSQHRRRIVERRDVSVPPSRQRNDRPCRPAPARMGPQGDALDLLSGVTVILSRSCRGADVLVMPSCRRRNPPGSCRRGDGRLVLVEARDAIGAKLRISDRSALLADPRLAESGVRFH
jgi:hypothetical protein